jgi:hypothetical protein
MEARHAWVGAEITWYVSRAGESAAVFGGRIETADDLGDGIVRISGPMAGGGQFVLVANQRRS